MSVDRVIDIDEIVELVRYASYIGVDPKQETLKPLCEGLRKYQEESDDTKRRQIHCELLGLYADLCRLTHPVNGGTLVDTANMPSHVLGIIGFTVVFLFFGIGAELLNIYLSKSGNALSGNLAFLKALNDNVLNELSPFFWGGLGACVYLLKRLSDLAMARTFYAKILHGWGTRILLGAILGLVAQKIFNLTGASVETATPGDGAAKIAAGASELGANTVAFLAGVGTRVVYGAIEKTIDTLAQKMNLDAIRGRDGAATIRAWLSRKLSETSEKTDKPKRDAIASLIDEIDRKGAES